MKRTPKPKRHEYHITYDFVHSELIIHRKDGTIGKGSSSRRTYGEDPKRSKG